MRRQPGRILYISHASPVPAELGPARRNFHVINQLARFYDVSVLSTGTPSDAKLFARQLGSRVSSFEFVARQDGRRSGWASDRSNRIPASSDRQAKREYAHPSLRFLARRSGQSECSQMPWPASWSRLSDAAAQPAAHAARIRLRSREVHSLSPRHGTEGPRIRMRCAGRSSLR